MSPSAKPMTRDMFVAQRRRMPGQLNGVELARWIIRERPGAAGGAGHRLQQPAERRGKARADRAAEAGGAGCAGGGVEEGDEAGGARAAGAGGAGAGVKQCCSPFAPLSIASLPAGSIGTARALSCVVWDMLISKWERQSTAACCIASTLSCLIKVRRGEADQHWSTRRSASCIGLKRLPTPTTYLPSRATTLRAGRFASDFSSRTARTVIVAMTCARRWTSSSVS